jgi:uncharacterized membrane protein YbhN (UPF0104 family)
LKNILIAILKFAIPLAIVAWLLSTVDREQLQTLRDRPKDWTMLAGALMLTLLAVSLTFARWFFLVRALEIPFRLRDAFRLGFLGYLLNFVGAGSVGGDLFKAVFLAHEQPGKRAESVATVVVDRIVGLFALLLVASLGIVLGGQGQPPGVVRAIGNAVLLTTACGAAVIAIALLPGLNAHRLIRRLAALPTVGPIIARLAAAGRIYRDRWMVLLLVNLMSLGVHALFCVSIFLAAGALFDNTPSLGEHFVIVPLSLVAGALPITPAGLGTFEVAMERLYVLVPPVPTCDGILVAMVFRMMTIVVAAIGVVVYWTSRREMNEILAEADAERHGGKTTAAPSDVGPTSHSPRTVA